MVRVGFERGEKKEGEQGGVSYICLASHSVFEPIALERQAKLDCAELDPAQSTIRSLPHSQTQTLSPKPPSRNGERRAPTKRSQLACHNANHKL